MQIEGQLLVTQLETGAQQSGLVIHQAVLAAGADSDWPLPLPLAYRPFGFFLVGL